MALQETQEIQDYINQILKQHWDLVVIKQDNETILRLTKYF
jgi:hypothetical protein